MKTKHKPNKALGRRIKITKTGKLLRRKSFGRHLRAGKSKGRIRNLKKSVNISGKLEKKIRNVLGI